MMVVIFFEFEWQWYCIEVAHFRSLKVETLSNILRLCRLSIWWLLWYIYRYEVRLLSVLLRCTLWFTDQKIPLCSTRGFHLPLVKFQASAHPHFPLQIPQTLVMLLLYWRIPQFQKKVHRFPTTSVSSWPSIPSLLLTQNKSNRKDPSSFGIRNELPIHFNRVTHKRNWRKCLWCK